MGRERSRSWQRQPGRRAAPAHARTAGDPRGVGRDGDRPAPPQRRGIPAGRRPVAPGRSSRRPRCRERVGTGRRPGPGRGAGRPGAGLAHRARRVHRGELQLAGWRCDGGPPRAPWHAGALDRSGSRERQVRPGRGTGRHHRCSVRRAASGLRRDRHNQGRAGGDRSAGQAARGQRAAARDPERGQGLARHRPRWPRRPVRDGQGDL